MGLLEELRAPIITEEERDVERIAGLPERLAPDDVERLTRELIEEAFEERRAVLLLDFREELLTELLDGLLELRREVLLTELLDDRFDVLLDGRL